MRDQRVPGGNRFGRATRRLRLRIATRRLRLRIAMVLLLAFTGCTAANAPAPTDQPASRAPSVPEVFTTKTGIEMVLIPGGEFVMGDEGGADDEKPAHRVRVSPFAMDRGEVTQASYEKLMGKNPAKFVGPDRPVERVRWSEAAQYCNMRSLREGLKPCYDPKTLACDFDADGYRLPTEAEWEYACRAGTASRWSFGDDPAQLDKHAWFKDNAAKTSHPVIQKNPNPWGLYDMHGNVAEWCHDYYGEGYDPSPAPTDPRGPASGQERVLRGGSWSSDRDACRSSARDKAAPGFADVCFGYEAYGFRCVRRGSERSGASHEE